MFRIREGKQGALKRMNEGRALKIQIRAFEGWEWASCEHYSFSLKEKDGEVFFKCICGHKGNINQLHYNWFKRNI